MIWSVLLGFGALIALSISWPVKRASYWVALVSAGYSIPTLWWYLSGIHLYMLNIVVDATICIVIDRYAKERWELLLFKLYKVSVASSVGFFAIDLTLQAMAYISGSPSTDRGTLYPIYAMLLEGYNWVALAIIARTGLAEWHGRIAPIFRRPDIAAARQTLRAPRAKNSWQHR